jgi:hypothetical protein
MKKIVSLFSAILATSIYAPQICAQESNSQRPATVQQLMECTALADSGVRLTCYDTAVQTLERAESEGEIVIVERERVLQTRRALFGFTLPAFIGLTSGETQELDEVETTLDDASYVRDVGWTFHLADGSTWRQIDTTTLQFRVAAGLPVKIRRAAMGSFLLKVANNPAIRAKRQ